MPRALAVVNGTVALDGVVFEDLGGGAIEVSGGVLALTGGALPEYTRRRILAERSTPAGGLLAVQAEPKAFLEPPGLPKAAIRAWLPLEACEGCCENAAAHLEMQHCVSGIVLQERCGATPRRGAARCW